MNISTEVQKIKTYESQLMTLKAVKEFDVSRGRLKKLYEKYTADSLKIQKELDDANAPQVFYDKEAKPSGRQKKKLTLPKQS